MTSENKLLRQMLINQQAVLIAMEHLLQSLKAHQRPMSPGWAKEIEDSLELIPELVTATNAALRGSVQSDYHVGDRSRHVANRTHPANATGDTDRETD